MKQGNHQSRKSLAQDNARRDRGHLPQTPALSEVPPVVSWAGRIFVGFWILVAIGIVVLAKALL